MDCNLPENPSSALPGGKAMVAEEVVLVDLGVSLAELHNLDAPIAEVFAIEQQSASAFNTIAVPDHGAFVAQLITSAPSDPLHSSASSHETFSMQVKLPEQGLSYSSSSNTQLAQQLAQDEHELVPLSEDIWLHLRSSVDKEVGKFLHFTSLSSGCFRCLVVPPPASDPSAIARVLLTSNSPVLDPLIRKLRVLDHPPALEVLRSAVEGPLVGPLAHTGVSSYESAHANSSETSPRLFAFQNATVHWMEWIEQQQCRNGFSRDCIPPAQPLHYAGRSFRMSGDEEVLQGASSSSDGTARGVRSGLHPEIEQAFYLPAGGLIAHPVGSGKTVIASELTRRQHHHRTDRSLILCPQHIQHQWLQVFWEFAHELSTTAPLCDIGELTSDSYVSDSATIGAVSDSDVIILPFEVLSDPEASDGAYAWEILQGKFLICSSYFLI